MIEGLKLMFMFAGAVKDEDLRAMRSKRGSSQKLGAMVLTQTLPGTTGDGGREARASQLSPATARAISSVGSIEVTEWSSSGMELLVRRRSRSQSVVVVVLVRV